MKNGFAVTVGVFASVSTMMQSLASALQFSASLEAHRAAAEEYNKMIIRLKFEMEMPNEEDFTDKLETEIIDIQNKCKYFPPQHIVSQYDKMVLQRKMNKLEAVKVDMISRTRNSIKDNVEMVVNEQEDKSGEESKV